MDAISAPETVSIIIEQSTRSLLDRISFNDMFSSVARCLTRVAGRPVEVLLVGGSLPAGVELPAWARHVEVDGDGYYSAKNAGARQAHGDVLVFWDSDCRAHDDYLSVALAALNADRKLVGVTGVTKYDGSSWLTRLNTLLSFGYPIRGGPVIRLAQKLLENQTAETVCDERYVALCQSGIRQQSVKDVVRAVHQGHGVTEPPSG